MLSAESEIIPGAKQIYAVVTNRLNKMPESSVIVDVCDHFEYNKKLFPNIVDFSLFGSCDT